MTLAVSQKQGIREATEHDIPQIVQMGRNFLAATTYGGQLEENPVQMETLARNVINSDVGMVFVYECQGKLVGIIGLILFFHPMSGEFGATELIWWVEPGERSVGVRLLKKAQRWAEESGAKFLQMVAPTEKVEKFYERMGYERIEVNYQLRLKV